jgi:hypothetical protein
MSKRSAEIKKVWQIISVETDSILELRAIWPQSISGERAARTNHFRVEDYPSVDEFKSAMERHAHYWNEQGFNIYVVMNRIKPTFDCRGGVTDDDVITRTLLLVDIDRTGTPKSPATDREVSAAKALADQVQTYLRAEGWPQPILVMSGNGYHLYYPLANLPNTAETKALCRRTLSHLAQRFDNEVVAVDTVVFNASRITKFPGTIMRKGMQTEDRPYRMAVVCNEE